MKFINRTDMTQHTIPLNHWPEWCFNLWAVGAGDRYVSTDPLSKSEFPKWKLKFWRVRGEILTTLFSWWRWV